MMDARSTQSPTAQTGRLRPVGRLFSALGNKMPKGLYARALIIIIAPMVLLQSVVTFVFLERHWQTVTHRLSTVTDADRICVMESGRIIESGDHDELLNRKGAYARLYSLQFTDPPVQQVEA